MLNLFNRNQQLLEPEIIEWIFNTYAWAFEQFERDVFFNETTLVLPDNQHFPGKETSANGMASLILEQVKLYAGMAHWPTQLINLAETASGPIIQNSVTIQGAIRGKNASTQAGHIVLFDGRMDPSLPASVVSSALGAQACGKVIFTFHPQQLKSPEGMIAHFVQGLSEHLSNIKKSLPPGGQDYLPMARELIGIFMGFGIMFANSAIVARVGGCGGCGGGQSPVRQVYMSEEESTYALAVFCQLKGISAKQVTKHLKKHLRGFFKSALKECQVKIKQNPDSRLMKLTG